MQGDALDPGDCGTRSGRLRRRSPDAGRHGGSRDPAQSRHLVLAGHAGFCSRRIRALADDGTPPISRLIAITGYGIGDSRRALPLPERVLFEAVMGRVAADKERQESLIRIQRTLPGPSCARASLTRAGFMPAGAPAGRSRARGATASSAGTRSRIRSYPCCGRVSRAAKAVVFDVTICHSRWKLIAQLFWILTFSSVSILALEAVPPRRPGHRHHEQRRAQARTVRSHARGDRVAASRVHSAAPSPLSARWRHPLRFLFELGAAVGFVVHRRDIGGFDI